LSRRFATARLVMRPLSVDDAEALHPAYADPGVMQYWSSAPHTDLATTRTYLAPRVDDTDWQAWAITRSGDDRAIGTLAANLRRPGVSEIGYLLGRAHWGGGYAREAVGALIELLFRHRGMRRVFADTDPDNAASIALLERLGFVREGLLRAEWETHLGVRDTALYGLLASDWADRAPTLLWVDSAA
jgi:ribosomal-protein-alanine N-acetyltransferase